MDSIKIRKRVQKQTFTNNCKEKLNPAWNKTQKCKSICLNENKREQFLRSACYICLEKDFKY